MLWGITKAVLRMKFVMVNAYIKRKKISNKQYLYTSKNIEKKNKINSNLAKGGKNIHQSRNKSKEKQKNKKK